MKNALRLVYVALAVFGVMAFAACGDEEENGGSVLEGQWTLVRMSFPQGITYAYPDGSGFAPMRLYPNDSVCYECLSSCSASGMTIMPNTKCKYELVEKGGGTCLYFEDDQPRPLVIVDDSTCVIQRNGCKFTWRRLKGLSAESVGKILEVLDSDSPRADGQSNQYVISTEERRLAVANSVLRYAVAVAFVLLCVVLNYMLRERKRKKRVERQLRMIEEERRSRPRVMEEALKNAEEEFLRSDYYLSLRKRVRCGQRLKKEDWVELERQLQSAYPQFYNRMLALCDMSEVERQVSFLVRLHVPPTEIAGVINKEVSTVSSIRSRLYGKVFGRKGGAKAWDEFICSL